MRRSIPPALLMVAMTAGSWLASAPAVGQIPGTTPRPAAAKKGAERGQPVTVDADKMERFGKENLVVFTGNVVARQDGSVQYSDRMEVYLDESGDRILRAVSTGNVKIVTSDCRFGTAMRAEYFEPEKLARLIGDARVWQEDNVVTGDTIDFYVSEDRAVVRAGKQGRVKAQFFPKDETRTAADKAGPPDKAAPAGKAAAPCRP